MMWKGPSWSMRYQIENNNVNLDNHDELCHGLLPTTCVPDAVLNTDVDDGIGCRETGSCKSASRSLERSFIQGKRLKIPPQIKMPIQSVNSVPYMTMPSTSTVVPNTVQLLVIVYFIGKTLTDKQKQGKTSHQRHQSRRR